MVRFSKRQHQANYPSEFKWFEYKQLKFTVQPSVMKNPYLKDRRNFFWVPFISDESIPEFWSENIIKKKKFRMRPMLLKWDYQNSGMDSLHDYRGKLTEYFLWKSEYSVYIYQINSFEPLVKNNPLTKRISIWICIMNLRFSGKSHTYIHLDVIYIVIRQQFNVCFIF